jgi:hypothetical protein
MNACKISVRKSEDKDHQKGLDIGGRVILKWALDE